jgi:hypothetical protein
MPSSDVIIEFSSIIQMEHLAYPCFTSISLTPKSERQVKRTLSADEILHAAYLPIHATLYAISPGYFLEIVLQPLIILKPLFESF